MHTRFYRALAIPTGITIPQVFQGIVRSGNLPSRLRGKGHVSRIDATARATNISSQFVACERRTDFRQHHPKVTEINQQDDEAALATALSVTGTPEELDEQLPRQLVEFVETYLGLWSTLKSAKEQIEGCRQSS